MSGFLLAAPSRAAAHEELGRREGLDCRACHVGPDGGPLTPLGREYLWSGKASRLLDAVFSDDETRARSGLGDWSGEAVVWGRSGQERVLGRSETQTLLTGAVRVIGTGLGGRDDLSFEGEGVTRSVFASGPEGFEEDRVDVVQAMLSLDRGEQGSEVRLGRQWVAQGVGVHRLDGLALHRRFESGVELHAYGGVPSENGEGGSSGDLLAGGRLGVVTEHGLRIGASGFYRKDDTDPADQKAGLDLHFSPLSKVDASAHVFYDVIGEELYDSRVHVLWHPSAFWQLSADYSRTVPGLFIPKTSIFSVFSLDDYEELALRVTRRVTERLSVGVFERVTYYDDGSQVSRTGVTADLRYGPQGEDAVGFEAGYHDEERRRNGSIDSDSDALFLRAYHLLYWSERLYTSADVLANLYAGDPFARDSVVARLVLGYEASESFDWQLGVESLRTPEFSSRLDVLARLRWRF